MSGIALYSPEDITILLGGIYQIEGIHSGSFVSIHKDGETFKTSVSADGKVSRTKNADPLHTVSITLSSLSDTNDVMTAWAAADGYLYSAMFPLFIKDNNGTTMFYAPLSWIESVPDTTLSEDVDGRTWVIKTAGATNIVGGNYDGGVVNARLASLGFLAGDALF